MNVFGASVTTIVVALMLFGSRSAAVLSAIAAVCYLTEGQQLDVGGVHLTAVRLVLFAGLVRVTARGELARVQSNRVDRLVIVYALCLLVVPTIRVATVQESIYRLGICADTLAAYFVFASLLREPKEIRAAIARMGILLVPFAFLMIVEATTGRNPFAMLGGVYADSWLREGHVRGAGAFRNPITAGSFGATFALLSAGALFARDGVRRAFIGVTCSFVTIVCAHSSGPLLGLAVGLAALGCWPLRRHMRQVRWGMVCGVMLLALVMKAPVWFVIARISDQVGGGGYHRALLIDRFVNSFDAWWLGGTAETGSWFPYWVGGKADITNRFVADGLDAGFLGLTLSLGLVVCCFQSLGKTMKAVRGLEPTHERFAWTLGSTLAATVVILCSVTYFDQTFVIWYFLLACIARSEVSPPLTVAVVHPFAARRISWGSPTQRAYSAHRATAARYSWRGPSHVPPRSRFPRPKPNTGAETLKLR